MPFFAEIPSGKRSFCRALAASAIAGVRIVVLFERTLDSQKERERLIRRFRLSGGKSELMPSLHRVVSAAAPSKDLI